jgi:hypothetical protein
MPVVKNDPGDLATSWSEFVARVSWIDSYDWANLMDGLHVEISLADWATARIGYYLATSYRWNSQKVVT